MQKQTIYYLVLFVIGLAVGWLFWGNSQRYQYPQMMNQGMHIMPDGSMMNNADTMMHTSMSMESMMEAMTANLQGKTGSAFDTAFLKEMIPHHQGAVIMAEMVLKTSQNPELRKLAGDIIAAQNKEIKMMEGWLAQWSQKAN